MLFTILFILFYFICSVAKELAPIPTVNEAVIVHQVGGIVAEAVSLALRKQSCLHTHAEDTCAHAPRTTGIACPCRQLRPYRASAVHLATRRARRFGLGGWERCQAGHHSCTTLTKLSQSSV